MKSLLFSLPAIAVLVSACGGSDAVNVEGGWRGAETDVASDANSARIPQSVHAVGAFREDGYGFMFDEHGNYFVTPPLGRNPVIVWDMSVIEPANRLIFPFSSPADDLIARFQLSDQAVAASFTSPGVTQLKDCDQGCWVGSVDLRRSTSSAAPSSLPVGEWQGINLSRYAFGAMFIGVEADGSFDGERLGCWFSGILTPVRAGEDLYDVDADVVGCAASYSAVDVHYRGLGYLSDKDEFDLFGKAQGMYFYLGASPSDAVRDNPGQSLAMEFKVQ